MLKSFSRLTVLSLAVVMPIAANGADLKEAVPNDAYLAVWGQHNPERDYQSQYYQEVWDTIERTRIVDKTMAVIRKRLPERDREQFAQVLNTLSTALEPINWDGLTNCTEGVYTQKMNGPVAQHVAIHPWRARL